MVPKHRDIHNLSNEEIDELLDSVSYHQKKSILAQRKFETSVKDKGWSFHDSYKYDSQKQAKLICPNSHEQNVKPYSFIASTSCNECISDYQEIDRKQFGKSIYDLGYRLDDITEVNLICPKGHRFAMMPQQLKDGGRCPDCISN